MTPAMMRKCLCDALRLRASAATLWQIQWPSGRGAMASGHTSSISVRKGVGNGPDA